MCKRKRAENRIIFAIFVYSFYLTVMGPFQQLSSNIILLILFAAVSSCLFWVLPRKYRDSFLLFINSIFYLLCGGWFFAFVLLTGVWSFFCSRRIQSSEGSKKKWLAVCIIPLVLMLFTFKYWVSATSLLGKLFSSIDVSGAAKVLLPIGMSYYVLKSISYSIDIYRAKYKSENDIVSYLAYVSFFGQIIAGPIQRYDQWKEEMARENKASEMVPSGYYHIVTGLFMKLVIANRLASYVNAIFASPAAVNGIQLWLGFIFYPVYIYCDFAGYSHIAIGITNFFGLNCIDNFNRPYFSRDIREFWTRWHISLSSWLRDYIYIPMGGNRRGKFRRGINVMTTFLACGIWHGPTINFAVWGAYHGVLNILTPKKKRGPGKILPNILLSLWTFILVSVGWVIFATPSLKSALDYFKGMFTRVSLNMSSIQSAILPFTDDNTCIAFFLTVVVFIVIGLLKEANDHYMFLRSRRWTSFVWQVFILSSVLLFGVFGQSSFIYAGF